MRPNLCSLYLQTYFNLIVMFAVDIAADILACLSDLTGGPAATHSADAAPTPAPPPSSAASASSSAVAAAAPPPGLRELAWAELKSSRLGPYLRLKGGAAGNLAALRARIAAAAAAVQ